MDHALASVRRYEGLRLHRVDGVPSHMVVDAATRTLYVSDTGADRVLAINISSGVYDRDAKEQYQIYSSPEDSFAYSVWAGLQWSVLAAVPSPSGIALSASQGMLYVSSHSEGAVYALDIRLGALMDRFEASPGLAGLALDHEGVLWFANNVERHVGRFVGEACEGGGTEKTRSEEFLQGSVQPCWPSWSQW